MGKVNNALKMLAILRSRGKVSRKELAEELEVGIREISRYKDDLESAGVNITNIKGKYGGYILEHKDYLLNLELSNDELKSLDYLLEYIQDTSFPYYKDFKSSIDKIKSIDPTYTVVANKIQVHNKGGKAKVAYKEEREKWLKINDGIINSKKLHIKYTNANGESHERIVNPYGLFTYYDANYFIGFCEVKNDIRQFKLMRISSIKLLDEKFEKIDFDLNEYLENTIGLFKDESVNLKIKILYPYAQGFKEVEWVNGEEIIDYREQGYIVYKVNAYGKKQIINWIMGMGEFCEVLEPKELREEIIQTYKNILEKNYNRTI